MAYDVSGKRVLVTGASSGIGAGLAVAMARRGAVVGICARREARLADVLARCREHSPGSRMWVADLADPASVDRLAADAVAELDGVDVLVNNAGIPKRRRVADLDAGTVDAVMHLNYSSPVRLTLALLPQMIDRAEGRIVNVSSIAAHLSPAGEVAYSASKAALTAFSEGLAVELWDSGVKVLVVYPGVVDTELFTLPDNDPFTAQVPFISVDECVRDILDALERELLQVFTPAWFGELVPRKAADPAAFLAGTAAYLRSQAGAAPATN